MSVLGRTKALKAEMAWIQRTLAMSPRGSPSSGMWAEPVRRASEALSYRPQGVVKRSALNGGRCLNRRLSASWLNTRRPLGPLNDSSSYAFQTLTSHARELYTTRSKHHTRCLCESP